ncbi:MAG: radical SAM protein [Paraclostridium sp.]
MRKNNDISFEVLKSPIYCSMNITPKCNLLCTHCSGSYSENIDNELSIEEWKNIIDEIDKNEIFFVNITGGEPTSYDGIWEILDYLDEKNIYYTLSSNLIISEDDINKLILHKDYLRNIKVSVDGYDPYSLSEIRKSIYLSEEELFQRLYNNYNILKRNNIQISVATVLHKYLVKDISRMVDFIKQLSPSNWIVTPIIPIGRASINREKIIPEIESILDIDWNSIKTELENNNINFARVDFPDEETRDPYGCSACSDAAIINYNGDLGPCQLALDIMPSYGFEFGNLKNQSFNEIWEGATFNIFRHFQEKGCYDCKINKECKKCIPQSLKEFGELTAPTPYCIKMGENIGLRNLEYWKARLDKTQEI